MSPDPTERRGRTGRRALLRAKVVDAGPDVNPFGVGAARLDVRPVADKGARIRARRPSDQEEPEQREQ